MTGRDLGALALLLCSLALPARAVAPPLRYTVDAAAGTVRDNTSGLTWQRGTSPSTFTWDGAKSYCASLPLAGGGWRLPLYKEALTIFDPASDPAIDSTAFTETTATTIYWTASPYAPVAGSGWAIVYGFSLFSASAFVPSKMYSARCVR